MTLSGNDEEERTEPKLTSFQKFELIFGGIILGSFNNITTVWNAKVLLHDQDHSVAGGLTIFFLLFPGLVTSIGFLVLHWLDAGKRFGNGTKVLLYFLSLLFLYPIVPVALCIRTLVTGKGRDLAIMSKLFGGFLDDGPQFVLRLIVVVLYGIGNESNDVIFIISMVTSFATLVHFGLQFNERKTNKAAKWLLAFPMFAALLAARGFTLAVFLKETLGSKSELIGGLVLLAIYLLANIGLFKITGQDLVRSCLFGLSSTLIPVGYNNDPVFFQCPRQKVIRPDVQEPDPNAGQVASEESHEKMRSGLFLTLHTVVNLVLLSGCAIYVSQTRKLSVAADNSLIFSQFVAVIPGGLFTLARSVLLLEKERPACCHLTLWKGYKLVMAVLFGVFAYGSLIPAMFWSLLWKAITAATDYIQDDDEYDDYDLK